MKVLNLRCSEDHRFEGWFGSDDDLASQRERGLLSCPICNDHAIERLPSAPRVNVLGRGEAAAPASSQKTPPGDAAGPQAIALQAQQAAWLDAVRRMVQNTEDVGDRFPEEARRIHYGEAESRDIRGHASREDADALRDEGIEVYAIALPESAKGPLQ